jgi:hypothetical protein
VLVDHRKGSDFDGGIDGGAGVDNGRGMDHRGEELAWAGSPGNAEMRTYSF